MKINVDEYGVGRGRRGRLRVVVTEVSTGFRATVQYDTATGSWRTLEMEEHPDRAAADLWAENEVAAICGDLDDGDADA